MNNIFSKNVTRHIELYCLALVLYIQLTIYPFAAKKKKSTHLMTAEPSAEGPSVVQIPW